MNIVCFTIVDALTKKSLRMSQEDTPLVWKRYADVKILVLKNVMLTIATAVVTFSPKFEQEPYISKKTAETTVA